MPPESNPSSFRRGRFTRSLSLVLAAVAVCLSAVSANNGVSGEQANQSAKIDDVELAVATPAKFGAYAPPAPEQGLQAITALEQAITRPVQVVSFYQAWGDGDHSVFHPEWVSAAATGGRDVLLTWEPWVSGGAPDQPNFSFDRILAGQYDGYIRSWARGIRSYNGTVYLRLMHEMNGTWYPWSGVTNGNTPAKYISVWRRIHTIFKNNRVTNVRWVWSPLVDDVPSTNKFEQYYPGSAYVNVLALDGYNWGDSEPGYGGWRSFSTVFSSAYSRISALGSHPIWIAETSSAAEGGDKTQWVRDMFNALPTQFPRVSAVVWFNLAVAGQRDWRATSPAEVAAAF